MYSLQVYKHSQVISITSVASIDHCYGSIGEYSTHSEVNDDTDKSHLITRGDTK